VRWVLELSSFAYNKTEYDIAKCLPFPVNVNKHGGRRKNGDQTTVSRRDKKTPLSDKHNNNNNNNSKTVQSLCDAKSHTYRLSTNDAVQRKVGLLQLGAQQLETRCILVIFFPTPVIFIPPQDEFFWPRGQDRS
jgi:hypothetical protein